MLCGHVLSIILYLLSELLEIDHHAFNSGNVTIHCVPALIQLFHLQLYNLTGFSPGHGKQTVWNGCNGKFKKKVRLELYGHGVTIHRLQGGATKDIEILGEKIGTYVLHVWWGDCILAGVSHVLRPIVGRESETTQWLKRERVVHKSDHYVGVWIKCVVRNQ